MGPAFLKIDLGLKGWLIAAPTHIKRISASKRMKCFNRPSDHTKQPSKFRNGQDAFGKQTSQKVYPSRRLISDPDQGRDKFKLPLKRTSGLLDGGVLIALVAGATQLSMPSLLETQRG